jgi:hypothetical protein
MSDDDDDDYCRWCDVHINDCPSDPCEERVEWQQTEYGQSKL